MFEFECGHIDESLLYHIPTYGELMEEIVKLKEEIRALEESGIEESKQMCKLIRKLSTKDTTISSLKYIINECEVENEMLKKRINDLEESGIEALEESMKHAPEDVTIAALKCIIKEYEKGNSDLFDKVNKLEYLVTGLERANENLNSVVSELKEENIKLKVENVDFRDKILDLFKEKSKLFDEVNNLESVIEELQEENIKLSEVKIGDAVVKLNYEIQAEIDRLKAENKALKTMLLDNLSSKSKEDK